MDDSERLGYDVECKEVRAALKEWEGDWAKNNGKKPSQKDIKQNPGIAQKYKKYNRLRDILSGKIPPPSKHDATKSRKRKTDDAVAAAAATPSKRSRPVETPQKSQRLPTDLLDGVETPAIRRLFSPAMPTTVGPTPQRDGRVLGMFDLLEETDETPSKGVSAGEQQAVSAASFQATPSKRKHDEAEAEPESTRKLRRTPVSASKRAMLDHFMTPQKSRRGSAQGARTPGSGSGSVSKLHFSTPAFLRRAALPPVDENGVYQSPPAPLRLPRKPLVRGLSSVVANLRKLEEEKLDEDLEALHDMENEHDAGPSRPTAKSAKAKEDDEILVPDSQAAQPQLLGGFDDEGLYDSEPEKQLGRDGQPLREYKKKGQKRTTRRSNMKPVRAKRPIEQPLNDLSDDEAPDEVVPETQLDASKSGMEPPEDLESGSDFAGSADEDDGDDENKENQQVGKKKKPAKAKTKAKPEKKEEGTLKKAAKKVSATAHQNFKRLKLKNSGAKGGPGFGSRFRRRK